jgi:hypothetical protein
MLAAAKTDAFAFEDIVLCGYSATRPDGTRLRTVDDYLSHEPDVIMLRRDHQELVDLLRASFEQMAGEVSLGRTYSRRLMNQPPNGERLGIPLIAHLAEMYRGLGQPDWPYERNQEWEDVAFQADGRL